MSSAKRIGSFFGIKRRPSNINTTIQDGGAGHSKMAHLSPIGKFTDFDKGLKNGMDYTENDRSNNLDSSPPYEQSLFTISDQDPFAPPQWHAPVPPPLPEFAGATSRTEATIKVHTQNAEWQQKHSSDLQDAFQEFRDPEDFEAPTGSSSDQRGRLGRLPQHRRPSNISVDSLVSAHANASRNANVMVFQLEDSGNAHGISPRSDESTSLRPSNYHPPYYSGILPSAAHFKQNELQHGHRHAENDIDEERQVVIVSECSAGSHEGVSLPTTPALIDSFPPTPETPLTSRPGQRPVLPMLSMATPPVQVPHSRRGRQLEASSPNARSLSLSPIVTASHNPDVDGVFDVAEQDEDSQSDYNYSSTQSPSQAGPSSGLPPPSESNSHWFHPSSIHKHFHPADFDLTSLTRKLTSSSRPGTSTAISANSSGSDTPKMIKKSSSYSRLRKETSCLSGSSAASSSQGILSSASASSTAVHLSGSPKSDHSTAFSPKRQLSPSARAYPVPPVPALSHRTSFGSRPIMETATTAPLKLKDKEKKAQKDKDLARNKEERGHEKERDQGAKRRFFSKYASVGSHVEKEAAAMIAKIVDLEDARSIMSMRNGGAGLPDEEWSANLSMALSSSLKTQESSVFMHSTPPSNQQKSPSDDHSSFFASQSPTHSALSPTTSESPYVVKHIVPPAELLRLERTGFTDEGMGAILGTRGRDVNQQWGSPTSTSPISTSPGTGNSAWNRRSTSTSRLPDSALSPIAKTRSQRSGSLAVPVSSPSSPSLLSNSSRSRTLDSPKAQRPSTATPPSSQPGSVFNSGLPQRRASNGSALSTRKIGDRGAMTSPPSPAELESPVSLPPPPRPRIQSARSSTDIRRGLNQSDSSVRMGPNVLSPPPLRNGPDFNRRPSIASTTSTGSSVDSSRTQVAAQRPQSMIKKSNFLDMADDEGRPSLEEATLDSAPGVQTPDNRSYTSSNFVSPPSRSRSHTVSTTWTSSAATAYSNAELAMTSFPTRPAPSKHVDSFLDMGKLSLDTIRSEDEERFSPDPASGGKLDSALGTSTVPPLSRYQYSTTIGIGSGY